MIMEYAYATCILTETGEEINEENLTAVLEAAGCSVIESRVKAIVAALEDVDVGEVTGIDVEDASNASPLDQEIPPDADEGVTRNGDGTVATSGAEPATEADTDLVRAERNGGTVTDADATGREAASDATEGDDGGQDATDGDDDQVSDEFDEGTTAEPAEEG